MHVNIALVQMDSGELRHENLTKALRMIDLSADQGAEMVFLPENFDQISSENLTTEPIDGPTIRALQEKAKEKNIWLHAGSFCEWSPSGKPFNTSLVIDNQGQIQALYRKIHLFDVTLPDGKSCCESSRRSAGDQIVTVQTPWGKMGLAICYDLRFAELFRSLALQGASLMALPANFTSQTGEPHWELLLRARAVENGAFVIATGQTGTKSNFQAWGHSTVVDPWGKVIAQLNDQEDLLLANLDLSLIQKVREQLPCLQHRRLDLWPERDNKKEKTAD